MQKGYRGVVGAETSLSEKSLLPSTSPPRVPVIATMNVNFSLKSTTHILEGHTSATESSARAANPVGETAV